jgi:hypothetical protein
MLTVSRVVRPLPPLSFCALGAAQHRSTYGQFMGGGRCPDLQNSGIPHSSCLQQIRSPYHIV